ncbi:MAG: YihY/virulence factor BrkB family protein [Candidatus Dadabacteria bacterium]
MKKLKKIFVVLGDAAIAFSDDSCFKLSASLSYYTVFALAPLSIVIISLVSMFYGKDAASGALYGEIKDFVGPLAASQIQEIIANIENSHSTLRGAIIGGVIVFIGATGMFTEIQGSLDFIWSVRAKPRKGSGWRKYLINRLISFSLVLGLGFLLFVTLIINTVLGILSEKLIQFFPHATIYFIDTMNTIVLLIVITSLFMVLFKVLPDAIISWRDALVGSAFTAVLFLGGKYLIGLYIGKANLGITYGTAASIVIILSWVYYFSLILYFGAEFTKIFALQSGHGIRPKDTAVFIIKRESAEIPMSRLD